MATPPRVPFIISGPGIDDVMQASGRHRHGSDLHSIDEMFIQMVNFVLKMMNYVLQTMI